MKRIVLNKIEVHKFENVGWDNLYDYVLTYLYGYHQIEEKDCLIFRSDSEGNWEIETYEWANDVVNDNQPPENDDILAKYIRR